MPARLLIFSSEDSNIRYASGLNIPDPFIYVRLGAKEYVLVNGMEFPRARKEVKRGIKVMPWDDVKLDNVKIVKRKKNLADIAAAFILSFGETQVRVPSNTWALHMETLKEHGIRARIEDPFYPERQVKTDEEVKAIERVGRVARQAFERAMELLDRATIEWDDNLVLDGEKLTSERLRMEIENVFLANDCQSGQTIVACGKQTAEPHNRGSGPLYAGKPIIIDIFPRDMKTGYHFDLTRTVVKGTPTKELQGMHDAVKEAQEAALEAIRPGPAQAPHDAAVTVFRKRGYDTTDEEGFVHSAGHGIGLDVHESPRLSRKSDDDLEEGMVVTVEPGLYYKDHGGVRIEDTVLVTKDGCRNLTDLPKTLTTAKKVVTHEDG